MDHLGCLVCVAQSTVGVVEKWGKFSGIAQPGLHCLNPCAGEWLAGRLSLRVQSMDVRCDTKTKVRCDCSPSSLLSSFFWSFFGSFFGL